MRFHVSAKDFLLLYSYFTCTHPDLSNNLQAHPMNTLSEVIIAPSEVVVSPVTDSVSPENPFAVKAAEEAVKPVKTGPLASVIRGKKMRPLFGYFYGPEGNGKTTFASKAPNPIFLQTERGVDQLDVNRFPIPVTYAEFLEQLDSLEFETHDFKTIVVDTVDGLEFLIWNKICNECSPKVESIEQIPYGAGYAKAKTIWRALLSRLTRMSERYNIVLIGHAIIKPFSDPTQLAPYDQWRPRLHDKSSEAIKESVDLIGFACIDIEVFKQQNKSKAVANSGQRVLHTQPTSAGYLCKNRFNLPDPMPLEWSELRAGVKAFYEAK